jgi:predicted Zn-dependent protease with MMP-like domain
VTFDALSRIARDETHRTLATLPAELHREVARVPVFFESRPDDPQLDPDLLGLFDPGPEDAGTPRILLWLDNLWEYAGEDPAAFAEEVRITLLHEIGHLFGWDEDDLEDRGLG